MNSGEIFEAPPSNAEAATASAVPDNGKENDNTAGSDGAYPKVRAQTCD